jgi:multiple sugar transport system ATP-binding protein
VFLFDEPLSNLDAALRVGMRGELIKLHHRLGATMIYVTHDQVEAMTMGDRICIMNGGKVAQIGAPLEVYRNPADTFVASFLGSPPTNLIPARFNAQALHVGEARLRIARATGNENVIFGIRPEDIRLDGAAPHAHGEVLAVEPLGAETLLRVRVAGVAADVMVRGPRTVTAKVGERVPLAYDLAAAHLFHPETQRRI